MKLYRWCFVLGSLLVSHAYAEQQVVQLEDGRKAVLNDDFTWQYLDTSSEEATIEPASSASTPINVTPATATTTPPIAAATSVIAGASLLTSDNNKTKITVKHSGVEVELIESQWEDDHIVFESELTNNGLQPVIKVDLKIEVYDGQGQLLIREEHPVFRSIKRMAETYLRPQQTQQGSTIKLNIPKQEQYQILIEIIELDHRG